jgi:hypothetical protein
MSLDKKYKVAVFPSRYVDGDVVLWYSPQCHMFALRYVADSEGMKTRSYCDDYYRDVASTVIDGRRIACTPLEERE